MDLLPVNLFTFKCVNHNLCANFVHVFFVVLISSVLIPVNSLTFNHHSSDELSSSLLSSSSSSSSSHSSSSQLHSSSLLSSSVNSNSDVKFTYKGFDEESDTSCYEILIMRIKHSILG